LKPGVLGSTPSRVTIPSSSSDALCTPARITSANLNAGRTSAKLMKLCYTALRSGGSITGHVSGLTHNPRNNGYSSGGEDANQQDPLPLAPTRACPGG